MINTKIYKSVYSLAEKLMAADRKGDQALFNKLFLELKTLCVDNENTDKDHPEQWETLADFTADVEEALLVYNKALTKAVAKNAKDHMASIAFSMATLSLDLGDKEAAVKHLKDAKVNANKLEDDELKAEIETLLAKLTA